MVIACVACLCVQHVVDAMQYTTHCTHHACTQDVAEALRFVLYDNVGNMLSPRITTKLSS